MVGTDTEVGSRTWTGVRTVGDQKFRLYRIIVVLGGFGTTGVKVRIGIDLRMMYRLKLR